MTEFAHRIEAYAEFSECRTYRYRLWRVWDHAPGASMVLYVMLNPSTADEVTNDPTIERCQRRAQARGYGGLQVVNLFALRSTDPKALRGHADPVGPENDAKILAAAQAVHANGGRVVCGWGTHGTYRDRGQEVRRRLTEAGIPLYCLGTTGGGEPRHPLYVSYAREFEVLP